MNYRDIEDTRQPPELPEAKFCDDCGEEMTDGCDNQFCPSRHYNIAHDMAVAIVELTEEVKSLKRKISVLQQIEGSGCVCSNEIAWLYSGGICLICNKPRR